MVAARYEVVSTLPPGAGTRTRLAWQAGEGGFRRPVVLRQLGNLAADRPVPQARTVDGVLPLLDRIELDGKWWAVYDFVAGATFVELSDAHFAVDRLPSLGLIGRVVVDSCRAIHRVHTRIDMERPSGPEVHGGLSDASVFVGFDGRVLVLDLNAPRLGKFVAPELLRGEPADPRADVFSLGAVLHHATTRFAREYAVTMARAPSPREFPPPSAVHPEANFKLDAVVMRALMPSPGSRFASAAQLADELEKVLAPVLFTAEQVSEVLGPLFGERMASLKELVDPKRAPSPSRPTSRPTAPPRSAYPPVMRPSPPAQSSRASPPPTNPQAPAALRALAEREAPALGEDPELPTQSHLGPRPPKPGFEQKTTPGHPLDFDPHATNPRAQLDASVGPDFDPHATSPRAELDAVAPDFDPHATSPRAQLAPATRPSRPSGPKVQRPEERARARGQEKISTADLDPDQLSPELRALQGAFDDGGELGGGVLDEPTNIKRKAKEADPEEEDEEGYSDPKKKEPTLDVEPGDEDSEEPRGRAGKILFTLFALLVIGGGAFGYLNLEQLKARLRPPPPPATAVELPYEEVVFVEDAGTTVAEVVEASDAGAQPGAEPAEADAGIEEEQEDEPAVAAADAGQPDAGAVKKKSPPPNNKKKKKTKKRRR